MTSTGFGSAFRHLRGLFEGRSVATLEDGQLLARFSSDRDEAAFEALVTRHGPTVLTTCRAVLRNEHDVEDAFQATFLVLARKARSIRGTDALGGWLHRVAYRAAVQASVDAKKRRRRELEASAMAQLAPSRPDPDLAAILHEEIDRLPEAQRLPVVLCDLEGLSYEQAARQLHWTLPALRHRLADGRRRLRARLTRRGVMAPTVGAILASEASAAVPSALARSTIAAGTVGSASNGAAFLTHTILRGMLMTKIKIASTTALLTLVLCTAGMIASGAGRAEGPKSAPKPALSATNEPVAAKDGEIVRVLDPEGKPAVGAKVYRSNSRIRNLDHDPATALQFAGTGPDGSFRLSTGDLKADTEKQQIVVMAEGCGPAFADPSTADGMKILRLAKDDVPIRGRILDTDGKPVAGASVQLVGILWHPSGKLDEWLAAVDEEKVAYPVQYRLLRWWTNDDIPSLYPAITTDREGRFTLRGVGRERIASLLIGGPGIETRFEFAATRDMPAVKVPDFDRQNQGQQITYHGASLDVVAGPGLEIAGSVRDKDTGKLLAGVIVQNTAAFGNPLRFLKTTTDAEGHYKLKGLPPRSSFGDRQDILASIRDEDGPPYLPTSQLVGEGRGTITKDFELKRGAWAKGRVTDKATGKPVMASLSYYILEDNPYLKDYPRYATIRAGMPFSADEDGRFRIVVMPGRGVLGARFGNSTYRLGTGIEKIPGLKIERGLVESRPYYLVPTNYNTIVGIDPKPGNESVTADIELDPGRTLKGKLVGPGGEPLPGAWMMGAEDLFQMWSEKPLPSDEFEVHGLGPEAERFLIFWHKEKNLAGTYVTKRGEDGSPTVKLGPCGSLAGRLVDDDGRPRAGVQMTCDRPSRVADLKFEHASLPDPIKTDADGRFRTSGLVPGLKYTLAAWKGQMMTGNPVKDLVIKPGEVKDLGDLKVQPSKPENE